MKKNNIKNILITGAGGAGTITAIKNLKESGKYKIIAGDSNPYAYGLKRADVSYVLPMASDSSYLDAIKDILLKEQIDYYIPLIDEEISKAYDVVSLRKMKLLAPSREFSSLAFDKYLMTNRLREIGVDGPRTFLATHEINAEEYPVFVKPRRGRGSRDARSIKNPEELRAFKILSGLSEEEIVVQDYLEGEEYTVSVVVNSANSLFAVVPKKVIVKRGITQIAVSRCVPSIEETCRKIVYKLQPRGPFNVQLKLVDDRPYVFEINPRYSTTLSLTLESGVDEIGLLIERYDEKYSGELLPFAENIMLSRHWESVFYGT
ncbi:MAG: ATP-grasp domain-containing protein [Candidatus Omnitrophota bacterium]